MAHPLVSRYLRTVFLAALTAGSLLCSALAIAHDSRPLFINISEYGEGALTLRWKTPPSVNPDNVPRIALAGCDAAPATAGAGAAGGVGDLHLRQRPVREVRDYRLSAVQSIHFILAAH